MVRWIRSLIGRALLVVMTLQTSIGYATPAGPYLDIPNVPFYVGQSVPPNILLTLDDSGSMMWGYVPDNFGGLLSDWADGVSSPGSQTIAFKSNLNGLYYNPAVTYQIPTDASGTPYSTSFTAAYHNGYAQSQGSMNLATNYRANQYYESAQQNSYGFGSSIWTEHCRTSERLSNGNCPG